ncbi:hypothetical protein [Streptomyces microflavus]|uniref:hypothetical protein n=1 Tax=Streptomyces microflavus TaxID=1919 RepID=UPI00381855DA
MGTPAGLLDSLRAQGAALGPWEGSVAAVRRELFLPETFEVGDEAISRTASPQKWLEAVYSDVSITTQVNDGSPSGPDEYRLPTSSTSQPSVMLEALELLPCGSPPGAQPPTRTSPSPTSSPNSPTRTPPLTR